MTGSVKMDALRATNLFGRHLMESLVVTSATLLVTSALLVVTMFAIGNIIVKLYLLASCCY